MAQATKSLKTGNKQATKPGKGQTFVVTQEAFDVAVKAGHSVGSAFYDAAEALRPLLYPLSARTDDTAVRQWREYARGFALGMADARGIDPESAQRTWQRIIDFLGFDKPQTLEALRKQKARQAAAPAKQPKGKRAAAPAPESEDDTVTVKLGAGKDAAQLVLSAMEAHIIAMLRAGKYAQAAQAVADMAEAAK